MKPTVIHNKKKTIT